MAPNAKRWLAIKPQVGNLSMPIKDTFKMLMKIFHRNGTEHMEDASHFDTIAGVWIVSIWGRHEKPIRLVTVLAHFGGIVMAITQHEKEGTLQEQSSFGNGANSLF